MLNIRDVTIDPKSLGKDMLLVDVLPAYAYADGKKTETITGYRYVVALPAHKLEKLGVKIEGKQALDMSKGMKKVSFTGLEVKPYVRDGVVQMTAKASAVAFAE